MLCASDSTQRTYQIAQKVPKALTKGLHEFFLKQAFLQGPGGARIHPTMALREFDGRFSAIGDQQMRFRPVMTAVV